MLNRKLAGLAAGAMTAGVLVAPTFMGTANAATTATYDLTYSCVGFGQTVPFETQATVTTAAAGPVANTVSVQLGDFPGIIPVALADRNWQIDTTVNDGVADIPLTGTVAQSVAPSTPAPLAAAKGSAARQVAAEKLTFGAAKVTITKTDLSGRPTVMDCTVSKQAVVPVIPAGHTAFDCTGPFGAMVYTSELKPTVKREGANVTVSLKPTDMAGIVPASAPGTQMDAEMGLTVNGAAVVAKGSHITDIGPGLPIALPVVKASVATAATKIDVKVTSFKISVPAFKMDFPCTLAAPAAAGSHSVAAAPIVKASSKTTITKAAVSKKTKKASVSVKVAVGKKKATGKVTIKIAKGKKTVIKKSVKLKSGKASLTSKKLKSGTYKVTVSYSGNDKTKTSKAKAKTFKVKK